MVNFQNCKIAMLNSLELPIAKHNDGYYFVQTQSHDKDTVKQTTNIFSVCVENNRM